MPITIGANYRTVDGDRRIVDYTVEGTGTDRGLQAWLCTNALQTMLPTVPGPALSHAATVAIAGLCLQLAALLEDPEIRDDDYLMGIAALTAAQTIMFHTRDMIAADNADEREAAGRRMAGLFDYFEYDWYSLLSVARPG